MLTAVYIFLITLLLTNEGVSSLAYFYSDICPKDTIEESIFKEESLLFDLFNTSFLLFNDFSELSFTSIDLSLISTSLSLLY